MRTSSLALATVLAAAALSVHAGPRMEGATSPFTYEAVGATPVVTFGRAATQAAAPAVVAAPKTDAATKSVDAGKTAANTKAPAAPARATASSTFTYDAVGATPHVGAQKQPARSEAQLPAAAH